MRLLHSVVLRLVVGLVAGGLLVSAGLNLLRSRNAEAILQIELNQRVLSIVRDQQAMIRALRSSNSTRPVSDLFTNLASDIRVHGIRLIEPNKARVEVGMWSGDAIARVIDLPEDRVPANWSVDLSQLNIIHAPFTFQGEPLVLEVAINGPAARGQVTDRVEGEVTMQWAFLGVMMLLGVLLLRRWVARPLSEIMGLVHGRGGAEPFLELARNRRDEFGQLAQALGDMLMRLETTTTRLRTREEALKSLYQGAPIALVSIDPTGRITDANRKSATLLGFEDERGLPNRPVFDFIRPEDRGLLRRTIDRVELENTARCELRVLSKQVTLDAAVDCVGVRGETGELQSIRLSIADVSEAKTLQRELAEKSQLQRLLIDHMSEAILLIDATGRVAAHNQKLAALLEARPGGLVGKAYNIDSFWDQLAVADHSLFVQRLSQIEAEQTRPAQERFETKAGTLLFQGIPVHDGDGKSVGRLWVVQDITAAEQSKRVLDTQTEQMRTLRQVTQELAAGTGVDWLLGEATKQLHTVMGVEAVGAALRFDTGDSRSRQVIHRDSGLMLIEPHLAIVKAIETDLMPQLLTGDRVAFWPELPKGTAWGSALGLAGLTSMAATAMRGTADTLGVLWIARRGGERIERSHLHLLEIIAPVLAGRFEVAQLTERMHGLELTDAITRLPNRAMFDLEVRRLVNRPGYTWAVAIIKVDLFRRLNELVDHERANEALRRVAVLLQQGSRKSCFIARLGGPAFGIVMPGATRQQAVAQVERLQAAIARETIAVPGGATWAITASAGVACAPDDHIASEAISDIAAARLEAARRTGLGGLLADDSTPTDRQVG